jgi:phospholipase/carboxylesterase
MVFLAPDSRASRTWDILVDHVFGRDIRFLNRALGYVFDRCWIDPGRIALGGFSDGASYALSMGLSNGDLFSHLVAYSPGFLRAQDPIVGNPRVFISHGTEDSVLPIAVTRGSVIPALEDAGYEVTYEEFEGGHTVPAEVSEKALGWFLG